MLIITTYESSTSPSTKHIFRYSNRIYSIKDRKIYAGIIAQSLRAYNSLIKQRYIKVTK